MSKLERKTHLADVPIGEKNESLEKYLREFRKRGVHIYDTTLSRIRGGDISGNVITEQLILHDVLRTENPALKLNLFKGITNTGKEQRVYQQKFPQRYLSEGFTQAIADELKLFENYVRICLRAMRADLILFCTLSKDEKVKRTLINDFMPAAETYLEAYSSPPSDKGAKDKIYIDQNWSRESIVDYYQMLYARGGRRTIGTWASYEIEVFSGFYALLSNRGELTPLDKLILQGYRVRGQNNELANTIREKTGIDYDLRTMIVHANSLAFGLPVNPFMSKSKDSNN